MANLALNAKRGDFFLIKPNDPNVEVFVEENPNAPSFDKRGLRPVNMVTVESMERLGQLQAAEGEKVESTPEGKQRVRITLGRGRWKAMNIVWERLRAKGVPEDAMPPFKLTVRKNVNDAERIARAITENEHRDADSPIDRAEKALALLNLCEDRDFVRVTFRLANDKALTDLLALLETDESVQKAVTDGTIAPGAARALAKLPTKEQKEAVEKIKATAPNRSGKRTVSVRAAKAHVRKAQGKRAVAKVRTVNEIKSRIDEEKAAQESTSGAQALVHKRIVENLYWVLGEEE